MQKQAFQPQEVNLNGRDVLDNLLDDALAEEAQRMDHAIDDFDDPREPSYGYCECPEPPPGECWRCNCKMDQAEANGIAE